MTVYKWSQTEISNATADSTINWQEGMAASGVNNSGRAMMAAIAKWRDDIGGVTATTGGPVTYLLNTAQGLGATPPHGTSLTFYMNQTNSAAATLRVDLGNTFPLHSAAGIAMPAGLLQQNRPYSATFNLTSNSWVLNNIYNLDPNLSIIPLGGIIPYAGATAPAGGVFALCAGQALSRTVLYGPLFAILGTTYGAGDGSTTFNIPDLRGRVLAGKDNMGGTAAGRISTATNDDTSIITGTTLGSTGGQMGHVQATTEMPSHSHGITDQSHSHSVPLASAVNANTGATVSTLASAGSGMVTGPAFTGITSTNPSGSSNPMNMLQPTIILNYLIRAI